MHFIIAYMYFMLYCDEGIYKGYFVICCTVMICFFCYFIHLNSKKTIVKLTKFLIGDS